MTDSSVLRSEKTVKQLKDYIDIAFERPVRIMEVCGTHTMSIARWGIKSMLPAGLELISGPGCPVCVTTGKTMGEALSLAKLPDVIFTCFGDMLRVPAGDTCLKGLSGADVQLVLSPLDALEIAESRPEKEVIFFAVGFETTAPLTAALLEKARMKKVRNFSILCAHKTMPAAIRCLLQKAKIDALLCPGHVAAVIGADAFSFLPTEMGLPAAVAGFEPVDLLLAISYLLKDLKSGHASLRNCYPRVVSPQGNQVAQALMNNVFEPCDAQWRGIGMIPDSGLALREEYRCYDALHKLQPQIVTIEDDPACRCGEVLQGAISPHDCPLFGKLCRPEHPAGACMVSSEGSCAAAYRYERKR